MNQTSYKQKRKTVTKEKKLEKLHYRILLGLMVLNVLHYLFLEPVLIGHDRRYTIYIFLLPTIGGVIALAIYRRSFLLYKYNNSEGILLKAFIVCFYFIQGLLFSYLSFGFFAKVSWNYFNQLEAENDVTETMRFRVDRLWTGKKPRVGFTFQNKYEYIPVNYQSLKEYESQNPKNLEISINVRKGLWNYYFVKDWRITDVR